MKERENKHKEYFNFDDSSDINIVSPKALEWRNGKYVLTIFTNSRYARAYRLEFMEDVKILSQDREHLHPEYVKHSTAGSSELLLKREGYTFDAHKEYAVTILIPEVLIEEVFRYWGHDTPIIPYDTYNVIFTVHTTLSDSFYLWLLDLGTRAKILAPVEAIGELFYFFNQIGNMYGYGSPDFLKNIPTIYDEMRAQKHGFKRQMRYMKHKK